MKANVLEVIQLENGEWENSIVCLINLFSEVKSVPVIKCIKFKNNFLKWIAFGNVLGSIILTMLIVVFFFFDKWIMQN